MFIWGRRLLGCDGLRDHLQLLFGHSRLYCFPNKLTVDIGNVCNLRCPLCPTGRGDQTALRGFMDFRAFKTVIDELAPYLTNLELHNWVLAFLVAYQGKTSLNAI